MAEFSEPEEDEYDKVSIYILKLRDNKYYVGKTTNLYFRTRDHIQGVGAAWTRKYPIQRVYEIFEDCDPFDEDKYVLKSMMKFGIDNVRGGSFTRIKLTEENRRQINRSISSAEDLCHYCGQPGHFIEECRKRKRVHRVRDKCGRCGRPNHQTRSCYAKRHVDGTFLEPGVCMRCGRRNHRIHSCYAKTDRDGNQLEASNSSSTTDSSDLDENYDEYYEY